MVIRHSSTHSNTCPKRVLRVLIFNPAEVQHLSWTRLCVSFLVHVLCVIIYCIQHMEGIYSRPMHPIEELIKKRRGRSQYQWPQPSTQTGEVFLTVMSSWDSRRWRIDWLESIWVHVESQQIFTQTFLSLVYDIAVKKSWKNTHKKLNKLNIDVLFKTYINHMSTSRYVLHQSKKGAGLVLI